MSAIGVISSLICIFAVICVALSLFSPGWLLLGGIEGIHYGLFYFCSLAGENRCEISSDPFSTGGIATLVLSAVSFFLGFPGSFVVLSGNISKSGYLVGGIFCLLSGALSVSAAGYFTSLYRANFGYSYYLAWVGGGLGLLGGLMSIGAYNQKR